MKFSIRDLLLVTVVVALALGWWLDRSRVAQDAARYKESLMKMRRMGFAGSDLFGQEMQAELNATWEAEHVRKTARPRKPVTKKQAPAPDSPKN